ncbi:MAG: hypothetical protein M3280_09310 [Actinomycetota bacterium]|nr:hypothetical protein [Actinomycetota bacterium]
MSRSGDPALTYRGHFQGGAQISGASGRFLARRDDREGTGYVIAEVDARRSAPLKEVPDRFWLHRRGAIGALVWNTQRVLGRRWYARNVRGREPLAVEAPAVPARRVD